MKCQGAIKYIFLKIRGKKSICNANGNTAVQHNLSLNNSMKQVHVPIQALSEHVCSVLTGYLQIAEIPKNHSIIICSCFCVPQRN